MTRFLRTFLLLILLGGGPSPLLADVPRADAPLRPLDCSSPRDTMRSFLDSITAISEYLYGTHWNDPSEETVNQIAVRTEALMRLIDASNFPPAVRRKMAVESLLHLAEVIRRIDPAVLESAPDVEPDQPPPPDWTVPDTEIRIVRIDDGERAGDYVFSAGTAARAIDYYDLIKHLPVFGPDNTWLNKREYLTPSGWILSSRTIEAFPDWMKRSYLGQGLWKILVLIIFIGLWATLIFVTIRTCRLRQGEPDLRRYGRKVLLPLVMIL